MTSVHETILVENRHVYSRERDCRAKVDCDIRICYIR